MIVNVLQSIAYNVIILGNALNVKKIIIILLQEVHAFLYVKIIFMFLKHKCALTSAEGIIRKISKHKHAKVCLNAISLNNTDKILWKVKLFKRQIIQKIQMFQQDCFSNLNIYTYGMYKLKIQFQKLIYIQARQLTMKQSKILILILQALVMMLQIKLMRVLKNSKFNKLMFQNNFLQHQIFKGMQLLSTQILFRQFIKINLMQAIILQLTIIVYFQLKIYKILIQLLYHKTVDKFKNSSQKV
ncbi:transmembrane protein, putative (macronuclear) [Tetrahymena thermophila SB210]|uniref:Transmembrane protein, putative n=1 Tax=Tetrahymena thermophila (strain SB210) TaxID=312017 RepID=W7XJB8_TETTS|nr:transmembrane protein, putative [Tetrahymena thermophila SB210]EWS74024.1 transmembrane protein, putative [Tetrahymena thermophila SB210]|eukprot:XP_012653423.1 transmembrane protein, putative [Tetrahymena thermophila SB210]